MWLIIVLFSLFQQHNNTLLDLKQFISRMASRKFCCCIASTRVFFKSGRVTFPNTKEYQQSWAIHIINNVWARDSMNKIYGEPKSLVVPFGFAFVHERVSSDLED
jgi:hypothetical protein